MRKPMKIAVCGSGADKLPTVIGRKARRIGELLAKNKIIVFTGATTGYSYEAAKGAINQNGITVGFSPAENEKEHVNYYKLPLDPYKIVIYTGIGYKARDILMIRSVDAVIFIGGGVGTICEMTAAIDAQKIIGVLKNSGGAADIFDKIISVSHRNKPNYVDEEKPEVLVKKIMSSLNKKNE